MKSLHLLLESFTTKKIDVLDYSIPHRSYVQLDLSKDNLDLKDIDITNHTICQDYIDTVLKQKEASVAYGGYLEQRNIYNDKERFNSDVASIRNIHLGIDFWCAAGTKVIAPLKGTVHSFNNNANNGDYGPTIILEHSFDDITFYTLYGHLSIASIDGLIIGKKFSVGDTIGTLGTPDINVNYAPHLHFQIIQDLEGKEGDYPGVCSETHLPFYKANCPDPNILLKLESR